MCHNCGKEILTMAFKGTRWCCENCRKISEGEVPPQGLEP